jgi:hypothetical protein
MKTLFMIVIVILALALQSAVPSFGQTTTSEKPFVVGADNNESSKASLDLLAERAGRDKLIVFVARLGTLEPAQSLRRRRLHTALEYLQSTRDFPAERLVSAFGDPISKEGRIEVYLDNKLFMIFLFKRNENFASEP